MERTLSLDQGEKPHLRESSGKDTGDPGVGEDLERKKCASRKHKMEVTRNNYDLG